LCHIKKPIFGSVTTQARKTLGKLPVFGALRSACLLYTSISQGDTIYVIDPNKCTECVGHYDTPQCVDVCPVDCIPLNPEYKESKEQLQAKYEKLMASKGK